MIFTVAANTPLNRCLLGNRSLPARETEGESAPMPEISALSSASRQAQGIAQALSEHIARTYADG